jgi:superfamily II DNA or RNA helicase
VTTYSLRPYQERAKSRIRALFAKHRRVLAVSPTGCHAIGQRVLMHSGDLKKVEDVKVGDVLAGYSGPRTVHQLCHGRGPMFRITPIKGSAFTVNDEHLLTLAMTGSGEVVDVTVREWLAWSKAQKHIHKLVRSPADFAAGTALPIDPYFMGVLLGDGSLRHTIGICKPDPEIHALVQEQATVWGLGIRVDGTGTSATMNMTAGRGYQTNGGNRLLSTIQGLGLHGSDSGSKFIPALYKSSDRSSRLAVLAGLMDTDGCLGNGVYDFISKSETLSTDVAFVARSVGLAAYVHPCQKYCQTGGGGTYYRVSISGDIEIIPCRIPRKQAPPRRQKKSVLRTGFSVEPIGEDEYYGFTLDGDGRYLLDDFTVTHNSGKTVLFCSIIRDAVAKGRRVLVVAHTREIVSQTSRKLDDYDVPHGVIMGSHWRNFPDLSTQIATIQTLVHRERPPADFIVLDEAQHCRSTTAEKLLEWYPNAPLLGTTATPWRGDGKGLSQFFDASVTAATTAELMAQGFLVRYGGFSFEHPDLRGVRMKGADYDSTALEMACSKVKIVGGIVEQWKLHAGGVRTILFAAGIAHSKMCVEAFRRAGVAAEHLDGTTPNGERDAILDRLASGVTRVLCNVNVLSEGWDCPAAACCILACPTKSLVRYLQQVGRVLRPLPGKDRALIFDHAGLLPKMGLPDEERDFSLTADVDFDSLKPPSIFQCPPPCGRIFLKSLGVCPECGRRVPAPAAGEAEREVEELLNARKIAIEEIQQIRASSLKTKAAEYKRLLGVARAKGYHHRWATHRFRATFGHDPFPTIPRSLLAEVMTPTHPCFDLHRLRRAEATLRAQGLEVSLGGVVVARAGAAP